MMRLFGLIITILALTSTVVAAQEQRDSIDTHEWAAKVTGEEGQLQPRYLPKGDSTAQAYVKATRWYNCFRIGLGTGYAGQYNKDKIVPHRIPAYAMLAYQFSPVHTLQGKLSYVELQREKGYDVRSASMELDYFVNFTNYTRGFKTNRLATFSAFVGIGGRMSSNNGVKERSPFGVLGVDVTFALGNNIGLSLQPYIGTIRDQPYLYRKQNTTFYEIMYGMNANLQFDFMRRRFTGKNLSAQTFFVEASGGLTMPVANHESTSLGSAYSFAFGYWPNRVLGMRLTAHAQDYFWKRYTAGNVVIAGQQVHGKYTTRSRGGFAGGRLEMLLAPLGSSVKLRDNKYVDWNIAAGLEYGKLGKADNTLLIRYRGATMSTQVLFKLPKMDNVMLFVEPRYSWIFYRVPYSNTYNKKRYKERFAMVSAGMRLSRDIRGRQSKDTADVVGRYSEPAKFFTSIAWGDMRVITRRESYSGENYKLNNSFVASFGRDFCPWATALLQFDYAQRHTTSQQYYNVIAADVVKRYRGMWDINYHSLSVRLMYQLRLNNLLGYHHSYQRFLLSVMTGPAFNASIRGGSKLAKGEMVGGSDPHLTQLSDKSRGTMAWAAGLQARFLIKDNWSVYIEPMLQIPFRHSFNRLYFYDHFGATYSF